MAATSGGAPHILAVGKITMDQIELDKRENIFEEVLCSKAYPLESP